MSRIAKRFSAHKISVSFSSQFRCNNPGLDASSIFRQLGTLLAAVFVLALVLVNPLGRSAQAGHWIAVGPGTQYPGTLLGGAGGAIESFNHWAVNANDLIDTCEAEYSSDGALALYVCRPFPGGVNTNGIATLHCDTNTEINTANGCEPKIINALSSCVRQAGNPVDVITGIKFENVIDFASLGPSPLELRRTYISSIAYAAGEELPHTRSGVSWRTNFDSAAFYTASDPLNPADNNRAHFALPDGREIVMRYDSTASAWEAVYPNGITGTSVSWAGPRTDIDAKLDTSGSDIELTIGGGTTYVYNTSGQLTEMRMQNGDGYTLSYDLDGNNTKVVDNRNRILLFTYNANGKMDTMTTPDGEVYKYSYINLIDFSGHPLITDPDAVIHDMWVLDKVTFPDDTPANDNDNPTVTYHYEDTNFPFALTGITDE